MFDPSTKLVTILVGLPACGKSTYVQHAIGQINLDGVTFVASSDDVIERIAKESGKTYNEVFQESYSQAEAECRSGFHRALNEEVPRIIVDRTNMSAKSRTGWIQAAKSKGYTVSAVVFADPGTCSNHMEAVKEWSRRLASRPGKTIPHQIIDGMIKSFVMPTQEEGFDEIQRINTFEPPHEF
jgi:predicted kinase